MKTSPSLTYPIINDAPCPSKRSFSSFPQAGQLRVSKAQMSFAHSSALGYMQKNPGCFYFLLAFLESSWPRLIESTGNHEGIIFVYVVLVGMFTHMFCLGHRNFSSRTSILLIQEGCRGRESHNLDNIGPSLFVYKPKKACCLGILKKQLYGVKAAFYTNRPLTTGVYRQ